VLYFSQNCNFFFCHLNHNKEKNIYNSISTSYLMGNLKNKYKKGKNEEHINNLTWDNKS
jgi:hypothetical protein